MGNILGISLGSRLLGIAVVYDGSLLDYRVRTFYGRWGATKRKEIAQAITKTIESYGITTIVVKTPKPAHCSISIQELLHDIRELSAQRGIKVAYCTVTCLKEAYNGTDRGNKQVLAQAIISKYPQHTQLAKLYSKEKRNRSVYHMKLFEAIACAELASKAGHL